MTRTVALSVLLLAGPATANAPPSWYADHRDWQAVLEFPGNDGVRWSVEYPIFYSTTGTVRDYPQIRDGLRTFTLTSPDDFRRHETRPTSRLTIRGTAPTGEARSLDVKMPCPFVHELNPRVGTFVRYRVEWTPDGIRATLLEERGEWRAVVSAYVVVAALIALAIGTWFHVRRRDRFGRTGPPSGN